MAQEFKLSTTLGGLTGSTGLLTTLLPNRGMPIDPDYSFKPYAGVKLLGNGKRKGQGFPMAIWRWNRLSDVHRQLLRAFCPDLSADVFIRTVINETAAGVKTWANFSCIMQWTPEDEDKQAGNTLGMVIQFTHLVAV